MKKIITTIVLLIMLALIATPSSVAAAKVKVAVIGSSTFADGCNGSTDNGVTNGFVMQLKTALPDHEFICDNLVQTGAFPSFFLTQYTNLVAPKGDYKELILYAGLNGLNNSITDAQSKLASIITSAKSKGIRVIGVGAQPFKGWGTWTQKWDDNIKSNNAWFKSQVDVYVDYYGLLDKNNDEAIDAGLSNNPLHTNDAGQKLLFQAVVSAAYSGQAQAPAKGENPDATAGATVWNSISSNQKPLTQSEIQQLLQQPHVKINIPGLNFSNIVPEDFQTSIDGSVYLHKPFFAEYIVAVYKYGIALLGIVCVFMIIRAGLMWSLPNSSGELITSAKKILVQSISALILGAGSYAILYTINPTLVSFGGVGVQFIQPQDFTKYVLKIGSDGTVVSDQNFHHNASGSNAKLTDQNIIDVSQKLHLDQCLLWAFVHKESGGNVHAIGIDANYTSTNKEVGARKAFLLSGKKYSGATFTPPATSPEDWDSKGGYKKLNNYSIDGKKVLDDDKLDLSKPPDYGLDWRFSHGISFLQITIFPNSKDPRMGLKVNGPNGPEWARKVYGRVYTVTDLLNPDTSLEAGIRFMTHGDSDNDNCSGKKSAAEAFKCMAVSPAAMGRALSFYEKCPLTKGMTVTAEDKQKYPAAGSH